MPVQKGMIEFVGRSDSDWAGDSATRQCAFGYQCNVQGVIWCTRSLKQTAISLSSCEAEFYTASACAFWVLHHFSKTNFAAKFYFVLRWTQILHVMYSREEGQDSDTSRQQCIREKRLSIERVNMKSSKADLYTKM